MPVRRLLALALLAATPMLAHAQTGPWARFDARMKGEALVREADGGSLREVESIVEGGGDVNWRLEPTGLTPLMAAASGGHAHVVAFLLAHGADARARDSRGRSALDRARTTGAADVVRLLATPGAAREDSGTGATARAATGKAATDATVASVTSAPAAASSTAWPAFGTYRVGDRVQVFAGSWRAGEVREVGSVGDRTRRSAQPGERKYRVALDAFGGEGDWADWGSVTGRAREPFWTRFFVGEWALGETFAMTTRVRGGEQRDEYSFGGATDALRVLADGRYEWKQFHAATIRGRWTPAPDGPGIVLVRGARGRDWTLRNETNATVENIRALQTARLTTPGVMSIAARRPVDRR